MRADIAESAHIHYYMLRIFAKWCKQYSVDLQLAPWQCLTKNMVLFDVVYLDVVQRFDIPNYQLLQYFDKDWSVDFLCRLALSYRCDKFDKQNHSLKVKYPFDLKCPIIMRHALDQGYASPVKIFTCVLFLMKNEEFEMAERVLESGADEFLMSKEYIGYDKDLASVVAYQTKNDIREMTDITEIQGLGCGIRFFKIPVPDLYLYALFVCYKHFGNKEKLLTICSQMRLQHLHVAHNYLSALLMLETLEATLALYQFTDSQIQYILDTYYGEFTSLKMQILEDSADNTRNELSR